MGIFFLVHESNRFVIYSELNKEVYREEFYTREEATAKYYGRNILEVASTDPRIKEIRAKYVAKQLNGDFLANMPDPLDDPKVCAGIMEIVFTKPSLNIRNIRLIEDSESNFVPANPGTEETMLVGLLRAIIDNLDELQKHYRGLDSEAINQLRAIGNNDSALFEVVRKMKKLKELYQKDVRDPEVLANFDLYKLYHTMMDFRSEHTGSYNQVNESSEYSERIYLNCHNEEVLFQFLGEYAQACIGRNISYDCKGMFKSNVGGADTTILYSNSNDFKLRLVIIEEIMSRHPEWRDAFEPPVYGTSKVGTGFYGVSHAGLKMNTYNDYFQNLCMYARNSLIAEILIRKGMIPKTHPNYEHLEKLAGLRDIEPSQLSIIKMKIGTISLAALTDIVEPYIGNPDVQEELMKTTPEEFKSRVKKLHAINQGLDPNLGVHSAISSSMIHSFGLGTKKESREIPETKQEQIFTWPKPLANEQTARKKIKRYDLNDDGFITVKEVIINLIRRLTVHIAVTQDFIEKKTMMDLKVALGNMLKRNRFDVEFITQIKDNITEYETVKRNPTDKHYRLRDLEGITNTVNIYNSNDYGREESKEMYKEAAASLYFKYHAEYKQLLEKLKPYNPSQEFLRQLESYKALGFMTFERMRRIDSEIFDMTQYGLFRDILNSVRSIIYQTIKAYENSQTFGNEPYEKLRETVEQYKKS